VQGDGGACSLLQPRCKKTRKHLSRRSLANLISIKRCRRIRMRILAQNACHSHLVIGRTHSHSYSLRIKGMASRMMRGSRRRWWGALVAIAYLFASMTPSLAIAVPFDSIDMPMPHAHEGDEHADGHQHSHASAVPAAHSHDSHDAALTEDPDDRDSPANQHANCCGSVLCFSAISPQTPSLVQFPAPRSRCESEPDLIGDAGAFRRHYRPPIV
jgi:hypothetical protein